ncbi:MAG: hypothetical protein LC114_23550, partial [Bryobacterales bacterium]|nr:hypothetical protein [Bryobacterales bacterium]
MRSRSTYSSKEAKAIRDLLAAKLKAGDNEQKRIRGEIRRRYGFYISDFSVSGAFGPLDFDDLVRSRRIVISEGSGDGDAPGKLNSEVSVRSESRAAVARADSETRGRRGSDEAYVIDLCDEILGQSALRQYRFPFLLGDGGKALPVDAYYPRLNLVVEYRERQHTESVKFFDRRMTVSGVHRSEQRQLYDQRRRDILPKHGITLI